MAERKHVKQEPDKSDLRMEYLECGKDYRANLLVSWGATVVFLPAFVWVAYLGVMNKCVVTLFIALAFSLIWLFFFEAFYVANERLKLKMRRLESRKFLDLPAVISRFSRTGKKESYLYSINLIRWSIFLVWLIFLCVEIVRFLTMPKYKLP